MGPVKAFSLSGRFSVSVAIPGFTSSQKSFFPIFSPPPPFPPPGGGRGGGGGERIKVRGSVLRQPQDALPQNVFQDLGGAGPDRAGPCQQAVVRPLPLVRSPGALRDLARGAQDLRRQLGQLLVHLAPGKLGGGPLGPGRLPLDEAGEAPVAAELEALLPDENGDDLLAHDRIVGRPPAVALRLL